MHKYEIIIYWSNEDQVFVVEVPELCGCLAHGSFQEEALALANEAIQLWIDTAGGGYVPHFGMYPILEITIKGMHSSGYLA